VSFFKKLFGFKPAIVEPPTVFGQDWGVYSYPYGDGLRAMVRFDEPIAQGERPAGHDEARSVLVKIPHEHVMRNGLPLSLALKELTLIEEALLSSLVGAGVTCRLVGVQTYSAMRDFVFQVADTAAFEAQIYLLAKQHRGPSAIELRTLSSWTFFEEKIVPDAEQREWMRNMNVIFALGESGSDRHAPHQLDHHFVGDAACLDTVRAELAPYGFTLSGQGDASVTLTQTAHLDADEVTTVTLNLHRIARDKGVEYDGWGAAVVRT
jgi:hypothetical protein